MKRVSAIAALATALIGGAALADPVTWTLNNVQTTLGATVTGSFVYDADTNAFSAINIVSSDGRGPFTGINPARGGGAYYLSDIMSLTNPRHDVG